MSFEEAIRSVLINSFNFNGRARRSEYWYFSLFVFLSSMAFLTLGIFGLGFLSDLWSILILCPMTSVLVRRLHDTGRSGFWALLEFLPLVGWIIVLIWLCQDSDQGSNQYGFCPK